MDQGGNGGLVILTYEPPDRYCRLGLAGGADAGADGGTDAGGDGG